MDSYILGEIGIYLRFRIEIMRKTVRYGQVVMLLLLLAITNSYAQVVTNTNAAGAGSLAAAIGQVNNAPAGAKTITFNIMPRAASYVIKMGQINLTNQTNITSLSIDATTQEGLTGLPSAGTPIVVIDFNGIGNGFEVGISNLTIKGLIVQNCGVGYHQTNGTNNVIEACWFGTSITGAAPAAAPITDYGVSIDAGTVTFGSKTNFTAATRNLVSACANGGFLLKGGSGSYIGNTFIGTDVSGTLALGNGSSKKSTESTHGITINGASNVTIQNNIISGNYSGGIDILPKSDGAIIKGNKIGTDITGTLPLGNKNFGVRVKESNTHTIGGPLVTDGNIISANGSDTYKFKPRTTVAIEFDWYNSCGIYLFKSSNNTIQNNYIGVDATGTKVTKNTAYDLGNFYTGIKIDGGNAHSDNNKIIGNVIGGNGFRSKTATVDGGYDELLNGHGIIIKDALTESTSVLGNFIGVGADGVAKVGNKQDGVSIQGATKTSIGDGTVAGRNIIGDNIWGIYIASNYWDSNSSDTKIQGNYIGVDVTGKLPVPNGRAGEGGGIGMIHYVANSIISDNVIAANLAGISMGGATPSTPSMNHIGAGPESNQIYNNSIGLDAAGAVLKNTGDGIYVYAKSAKNNIGLAGQSPNRIVGNGGNGIRLDSATSNTIENNLVHSNGANGILVEKHANGNSFFSNTIGDKTDATKGNKGDGLHITASASNIIGGVGTSQGNLIGNNTGYAVFMDLASSTNNSIHGNQMRCNTLGGISLQNGANASFAKPTFSGSPSSLTVTGPTGSYIELYKIDPCTNCGTTPNANLQGDSLVAAGPSPLTYAGKAGFTYTATASELGTTTAHKTSQFSSCYSLCTPPKTDLTVTGSQVCQGVNGEVSIKGSEAISYQAYLGAATIGSPVNGPLDIKLILPFAKLVTDNNTITVKGTPSGSGCLPVNIKDVTVIVNPPVNTGLAVLGSTVCKNTNGKVTIKASETIFYQAYIGLKPVGAPVKGTGFDIDLSVPFASLVEGNNTISFAGKPTGIGCDSTPLTNKATVYVHPTIKTDLEVVGSVVCLGMNGKVTIKTPQAINYQAYINGKAVGPLVSVPQNPPAEFSWEIPAASLATGDNVVSFKAKPVGLGCDSLPLNRTAIVTVNTPPKTNSDISTNTPICLGGEGILTVLSPEIGKSYIVMEGAKAVSALISSNKIKDLAIDLFPLAIGTHKLSVNVSVPGCTGTFTLAKETDFVVNKGLDSALVLKPVAPVCLGTLPVVTIVKAQVGVEYVAYDEKDNAVLSDQVIGTGRDTNVVLKITKAGTYTVYFKATIGGCGSVKLGNKATAVVNTDVKKDLVATATGPICLGGVSVVSIQKAEKAKTYQVFEKGLAVSTTKAGNDSTLTLDVPNLTVGDHTFSIFVTVPGCKSDTLSQHPTTKVNTSPSASLKVGTNGPVCAGNTALFYILKPEAGKKYQIFKNDTILSHDTSGTGDTLKIVLLVAKLKPGKHVLSAKVTSEGCKDTVELTDKGTIEINSIAKRDLNVVVSGPVCLNNPAVVTVLKSEIGKFYQVFSGNKAISDPKEGNGDSLKVPIVTTGMLAGDYPLSIGIGVPGCTYDTLVKKPVLTINTTPRTDMTVTAVEPYICVNSSGAVQIFNIQPKVSYQAYINQTDSVSALLAGVGPNLILPIRPEKLKIGLNSILIKAFIAGCTPENLTDTAGITVSPNPKLDLAVSVDPDVICEGVSSILTLSTSEKDVSYHAEVGGKIVSASVISTGGKVELKLQGLPLGKDTVKVVATARGCQAKELDSTAIITVNKGGKIDYGVKGDTVCKGESASITIDGSEVGVTYDAYLKSGDNTPISIKAVPGTGGPIVIGLVPSNNAKDIVIVKANVGGCGAQTLTNEAVVVTNDIEVSRTLPVEGSTVCRNDVEGYATIKGAKKDVSYQATMGQNPFTLTLVGNDADLLFAIPKASLELGTNVVTFTAIVQGCGPVVLDNTASVIVNDNSTSKELDTEGSTVCRKDSNATAKVLGAKKGIGYQAFLGDKPVSDVFVSLQGGDLILNLPTKNLASGKNTVTFYATVAGCDPVKLDSLADVFVLGEQYNIIGDRLRCYDSEGTYSIDPVPGVSNYEWKVSDGITIKSGQGTRTVVIGFGRVSGDISVAPQGTLGPCDGLDNKASISVEPAFEDTIQIKGDTLVCVNDKEYIHADSANVIGVDYIEWTWSNTIQQLDTIHKKAVFPIFHVAYPHTGVQMITARPHIRCSNTFGKTDTLLVKVLAYPTVEAGDYPVVHNDLVTPVPLNGTGSSVNGTPPNDSLSYEWSTFDKTLELFNSKTLNGASFRPKELETKVYLTVRNHGQCSVTDSAIVTVTVDIDIPNVFSPNNDGVHDTWEIRNLNTIYPNVTVEVFNKWGSRVFHSLGYATPWDGTRNGEELPVATYYYVIDFKNGTKPDVRSVTIIR